VEIISIFPEVPINLTVVIIEVYIVYKILYKNKGKGRAIPVTGHEGP
jgi:hypothetical protein